VIENAKRASLNEIMYSTFRFIVEHSRIEYYVLKRLLEIPNPASVVPDLMNSDLDLLKKLQTQI
jgi:hypothetical protein